MDPDISPAAVAMIQRFGMDAAERAVFRDQLMLECGREDHAMWRAAIVA
jgi:hypothetical protein